MGCIGIAILAALLTAAPAGAQTPVVEATNAAEATVLQVNDDGGLLAPGVFDTGVISVEGAGTRLMWHPAKAAFRAGRVGFNSDGSEWDAANVGDYSAAFGRDVTASGYASTAMGSETTASGDYSTAMGRLTMAHGDRSTAMGFGSEASEFASTAMGDRTTASGNASTAMGGFTEASGSHSTTMGSETTASGDYSTAMGYLTTASGDRSTAMGSATTASGDRSTAMGVVTTASGTAATAMGSRTTASGAISTAIGAFTTAQAYASLVIGRYNVIAGNPDSWSTPDPLFVAGNGSSTASRSNALTLFKDGRLTIAGMLTENSDRRLKADITPLGSALEQLLALEPVRYRFKDGTNRPAGPQLGLIAQEVKSAFPELVSRCADGYLSVA